MADVRRILKLREDKTALTNLIQKGSVGDDLLVKFQKAEKELEAEVLDVVNEANSFANAWGPGIFQTAQEMVQQQGDAKHRDQIYHVGAKEGQSAIHLAWSGLSAPGQQLERARESGTELNRRSSPSSLLPPMCPLPPPSRPPRTAQVDDQQAAPPSS